MNVPFYQYIVSLVFLPLIGSLVSGLGAKRIGVKGAHWVTIGCVAISFFCALRLFDWVVLNHMRFSGILYHWAISGSFNFDVGFLLDRLSAAMIVIVTFVSLLVHIYSIGYMKDDPSNQRFFSYVSLFTFAMLMLVTANNLMQLFFGWEGVGVASYLLIGFWFYKESAATGSLKAFIVNRIGDCGLILAIGAIIATFGTVDYAVIFSQLGAHAHDTIAITSHVNWSMMTLICVLLFVGAMAKSAQIPLHVWLPESMEGPTPISALIHAATMVTAGIFLVARMSPLFELSSTALSLVLVVGATGGLFLGLLAFVEYDIKRVIAYSTMSQLGYMMAANGVSAYSAAIFHLATHACFKALLFLSAGSVILALHHEQDLRYMGNLRKYIPVTYICFLIGSLALAAIPPFSGFYSKDAIIEAVHLSKIPGAHYAYFCLLMGCFVTAYYSFRALFLCFHGEERFQSGLDRDHIKEHRIMTWPLVALAIPSLLLGILVAKPMLYNIPGWLGSSITTLPQHDVLSVLQREFKGLWYITWHALFTLPFWFSVAGILAAYLFSLKIPSLSAVLKNRLPITNKILVSKFGFDTFNDVVVVGTATQLSQYFYKIIDMVVIDRWLVNDSGKKMVYFSKILRRFQTGYLYHYVFVMIIAIIAFLIWMVL